VARRAAAPANRQVSNLRKDRTPVSQRIAIRHGDTTWYTTGTLEEVCEKLNAGVTLTVWGFNQNGDRWEEEIVFYGTPEFVVTDKS
jgi:hypothetical protein